MTLKSSLFSFLLKTVDTYSKISFMHSLNIHLLRTYHMLGALLDVVKGISHLILASWSSFLLVTMKMVQPSLVGLWSNKEPALRDELLAKPPRTSSPSVWSFVCWWWRSAGDSSEKDPNSLKNQLSVDPWAGMIVSGN